MTRSLLRTLKISLLLFPLWLLSGCAVWASNHDPAPADLEEQVLQIIRDHPEVIIESLQRYQERQTQQQDAALLQRVFAQPAQALGSSPRLGDEAAELILVEFSDFQCPFCKASEAYVSQFLSTNPQVALVYKHFPLASIHAEALPSARAAWAAHQQGQFWEYHRRLFDGQSRLGAELYGQLAQELQLDLEQFERDRTSEDSLNAIEQDMRLGQSLGLQGTPLFVLYNLKTQSGALLRGVRGVQDFQAALDRL